METEMIDPSLVRMAFYDGSDGPRVMLFGPRCAAFELLQQCFLQLARCGESHAINLDELPWIFATRGITVRLTLCNSESDSPQQGVDAGIRRTHIDPPSFEWKRTKEGWQYLGDMIQGLLDSDADCHQYLTTYPNEDAIVVLSKDEYTDDVLEP